jgi:class 3 adenylate cyclase
MLFYNSFLAISLRSKEYGTYVLFCVAFLIFNMLSDGYPSETFFSHLPAYDRQIRLLISPITFVAYIVFSRAYLKTYSIMPKTDWIHYSLMFGLLFSYVFMFIEEWWIARNLVVTVLVMFIFYYAVVSVIVYIKGYSPALFYIAANSLLLVAGALYAFYLFAIIPHNAFTRWIEYLVQVASIFELAIFSLGLSHRIKIAEREKALAQAETIALLQQNEKIITLQKEELEKKVKERTEQLSVVNEELNSINRELNSKNEELSASLKMIDREKQISEKLLLNILPEQVASELKSKGVYNPRQYDSATILFADFENFTQIAEKLTPFEVVKKLDSFFLQFDLICEKYNLEKIKTIGDCYMAAGGLPIPYSDHAYNSVLAAQEMINSVKASGWGLRIGIHTGPVVAGVIGINKFAYDVWGDAVNIAARMEAAGEAGKINISAQTYTEVKDKVKTTYRGKIYAKNKGEIDMYFVEC